MSLVSMSASYGSGGWRIARAVAERLGVPFLDRAIPIEVAMRLDVSIPFAVAHDETVSVSRLERLFNSLRGSEFAGPFPADTETVMADDFRRATEEVLLEQAATGTGVILGRGGAAILRDDPRVLRVRLDAAPERRVRHAMLLHELDEAAARRALRRVDRMHANYLRHFYGVKPSDPRLYHLVIDSTAVPLDDCVRLISAAAWAMTGDSARERMLR